ISNKRDRDVDVGLLLLVTSPCAAALAAGHPLGLVATEDDLDRRAVSPERGQVRTLSRQPIGVILHLGSEVPDAQDLVMRPHPLDQVLEIKPEGPAPVSLMEPVVQVETVYVGDDGGHGAPRNIL